jgi:uncharacterized protein CbrC (UPF0167 family)
MVTDFPEFVYHPDPIGTGVIEVSEAICLACEQARGFIYTGPVYSTEELESRICPWCIADGSAHKKFDASFTDETGIGGYGDWEPVSEKIIETVAYQTPGFVGWQQERWWTHCSDAAIFLGAAGYKELLHFGEQAVAAIAEESQLTGEELRTYMQALKKNGGHTAYLFQCCHCGKYGGYSDSD